MDIHQSLPGYTTRRSLLSVINIEDGRDRKFLWNGKAKGRSLVVTLSVSVFSYLFYHVSTSVSVGRKGLRPKTYFYIWDDPFFRVKFNELLILKI